MPITDTCNATRRAAANGLCRGGVGVPVCCYDATRRWAEGWTRWNKGTRKSGTRGRENQNVQKRMSFPRVTHIHRASQGYAQRRTLGDGATCVTGLVRCWYAAINLWCYPMRVKRSGKVDSKNAFASHDFATLQASETVRVADPHRKQE